MIKMKISIFLIFHFMELLKWKIIRIMKDNGRMLKKKAKENKFEKMDLNMKAIGKSISKHI